MAAARLALFVMIHVGAAAIGFWAGHPVVWIAVWMLQAVNLLTTVAIVHECAHLHFFSSRTANRVTGTLAAAFGLASFEVFRTLHVQHHAHTCDVNDPEGEPYKLTSRLQIAAAFLGGGVLYALYLLAMGIGIAFGMTPPWLANDRQRRRVRVNAVVLAAIAATVVALVVSGTVSLTALAAAWFVPALLGLLGPVPFVLIPEHYDAAGPGPVFGNTRTCTSNAVLRFFYLNTNLHTAHHDRPSIPWRALPAHHEEIESRIESEWLFPSYTEFHRFMWRTSSRPAAHQVAT